MCFDGRNHVVWKQAVRNDNFVLPASGFNGYVFSGQAVKVECVEVPDKLEIA